jgi:hypothetical protein
MWHNLPKASVLPQLTGLHPAIIHISSGDPVVWTPVLNGISNGLDASTANVQGINKDAMDETFSYWLDVYCLVVTLRYLPKRSPNS